jgi:hypothetical protein
MSATDVRTDRRELIFEGIAHEALRSQMINLIWLHFVHHVENAGKAFQRGSMEDQLVKNMFYTPESVLRVFDCNSTNNTMDLVIFLQKKFGKVRTILPRDACYQCFLHFVFSSALNRSQVADQQSLIFLVAHFFRVLWQRQRSMAGPTAFSQLHYAFTLPEGHVFFLFNAKTVSPPERQSKPALMVLFSSQSRLEQLCRSEARSFPKQKQAINWKILNNFVTDSKIQISKHVLQPMQSTATYPYAAKKIIQHWSTERLLTDI